METENGADQHADRTGPDTLAAIVNRSGSIIAADTDTVGGWMDGWMDGCLCPRPWFLIPGDGGIYVKRWPSEERGVH